MDWIKEIGFTIFGLVLGIVYQNITDRIKYKRIEGSFFGYVKKNDLELSDKVVSSAIVKHRKSNLLVLIVTHNNNEWRGDLIMDGPRTGEVSWRYSDAKYSIAFQGKKLFMISDDYNSFTLFDDTPGFGNEYFKRRY